MYNERQQEINDAYKYLKGKSRRGSGSRGNRGGRGGSSGGGGWGEGWGGGMFSGGGWSLDQLTRVWARLDGVSGEDIGSMLSTLVAMLFAVYVLKKILSTSWKFLGSFGSILMPLSLLAASSYAIAITKDSDYIVLVLFISLYVCLSSLLVLLRPATGAFLFAYRNLSTVILLLLALLLLLCATEPIALAPMPFPKTAALLCLLALTSQHRLCGGTTLVLCYFAGGYYLCTNSSQHALAAPWAEFFYELDLLYVYLIILVFGVLIPNKDIREVTIAISSCMQHRNCSPSYETKLMAYLREYVLLNWHGIAINLLAYVPYLLLTGAVYRIVGVIARQLGVTFFVTFDGAGSSSSSSSGSGSSSSSTVGSEAAAVHRQGKAYTISSTTPSITNTTSTTTSTTAALDRAARDALIERVRTTFPSLTRADAYAYLRSRGFDIDATFTYLMSPSGKASRAALAREDPVLSAGGRGKSTTTTTTTTSSSKPSRPSSSRPSSSTSDIYPPVLPSSRTVLPGSAAASSSSSSSSGGLGGGEGKSSKAKTKRYEL
jgi:hypothetical protein